MNVRLRKSFSWSSGLIYNNTFLVNHYEISANILTVTTSSDEQNTAYERTRLWVDHTLENSILISQDSDLLARYSEGCRLLVFPEEPVDQLVGIMMYLKLNSIMQNRMVVTDLEISSSQGDYMKYIHSHGEALGPLSEDGWWSDCRPIWATPGRSGDGKVVNLDRGPEWKDFDLDWTQAGSQHHDSVVFADFNRHDPK